MKVPEGFERFPCPSWQHKAPVDVGGCPMCNNHGVLFKKKATGRWR